MCESFLHKCICDEGRRTEVYPLKIYKKVTSDQLFFNFFNYNYIYEKIIVKLLAGSNVAACNLKNCLSSGAARWLSCIVGNERARFRNADQTLCKSGVSRDTFQLF